MQKSKSKSTNVDTAADTVAPAEWETGSTETAVLEPRAK